MTVIKARLTAAPDDKISALTSLPGGEHSATISITKPQRRSALDLPVHTGPWDDRLSLRREDLYGDDGL